MWRRKLGDIIIINNSFPQFLILNPRVKYYKNYGLSLRQLRVDNFCLELWFIANWSSMVFLMEKFWDILGKFSNIMMTVHVTSKPSQFSLWKTYSKSVTIHVPKRRKLLRKMFGCGFLFQLFTWWSYCNHVGTQAAVASVCWRHTSMTYTVSWDRLCRTSGSWLWSQPRNRSKWTDRGKKLTRSSVRVKRGPSGGYTDHLLVS